MCELETLIFPLEKYWYSPVVVLGNRTHVGPHIGGKDVLIRELDLKICLNNYETHSKGVGTRNDKEGL